MKALVSGSFDVVLLPRAGGLRWPVRRVSISLGVRGERALRKNSEKACCECPTNFYPQRGITNHDRNDNNSNSNCTVVVVKSQWWLIRGGGGDWIKTECSSSGGLAEQNPKPIAWR